MIVILRLYRDNTPIMENQMEKKMENEMETGMQGGQAHTCTRVLSRQRIEQRLREKRRDVVVVRVPESGLMCLHHGQKFIKHRKFLQGRMLTEECIWAAIRILAPFPTTGISATELEPSYHYRETLFFTVDPYCDSLT